MKLLTLNTGTRWGSKTSIQVTSEELSFVENERRYFFSMLSGGLMVGAFVWVIICAIAGRYAAAMVPLLYILASAMNFSLSYMPRNLNMVCNIQVFMSLALPVAFQTLLGGYAASGYVMIWSLVSLMGAMTYQRKRIIYFWLAFYVAVIAAAVVMEPFSRQYADDGIAAYAPFLAVVNICMVSLILFFLSRYFILQQTDMRRELRENRNAQVRAKSTMEATNREMEKGLEYAKGIQHSTMPSKQELNEEYAEHFVLSCPKLTVSGDMYWALTVDHRRYFAVFDSAESGVPGAFVSMMAFSKLSEIINVDKLTDPERIIRTLYEKMKLTISRERNAGLPGIKMSLMVVDSFHQKLTLCKAGVDVYVSSPDGNADAAPHVPQSGKAWKTMANLHTDEQKLKPGTTVYFYTNGIAEQMALRNGGATGSFFEQLSAGDTKTLSRQNEELQAICADWKGENEQKSDILMVGLKLK